MKIPVFESIALDAAPELRQNILTTKNRAEVLLYIDYTKGSETQLDITVEHSSGDVVDSEVWFKHSTVYFDHGVNVGVIESIPFNIKASGFYRLPLSILPKEDKLRVTIEGAGTPDGNSLVNMWLVDDKHIVD